MSKNSQYIIPDNFIEGGRILNGMFKTRNFVEAICLSLVVGFPLWNIHYPSLAVKLTVVISVVLPLFLIAVTGINESSLLTFLKQFMKWKKNKRVLLYNGHIRTRAVRPRDVVMAQELPTDKLLTLMTKFKKSRMKKNKDVLMIEGENYKFDDSEEYSQTFINTEKKLMHEDVSNPISEEETKENATYEDEIIISDDEIIEVDNIEEIINEHEHPEQKKPLIDLDLSDAVCVDEEA